MRKVMLLGVSIMALVQSSHSMCMNGLESASISSKMAREFVKEVIASNDVNLLAKGKTETVKSCRVKIGPLDENGSFPIHLKKVGTMPFYNLGESVESFEFPVFSGDIMAVIACGTQITDTFDEVRNIYFLDEKAGVRLVVYNQGHRYDAKVSVDFFDNENGRKIIDQVECTSRL